MKQKNGFVYVILVAVIFILLLPIFSMLATSFKTNAELYGNTGFLPVHPVLDNYEYVLRNTDFVRNIVNSVIVSGAVTFISVVTAALAGYALTRFHGKEVKVFSVLLYLVQMIPAILLLMPLFMVIRAVGLYDKLPSLMIAYTAINLPICIYMMKSFFATIPYEIEESAVIDGCSQFKAFLLLVIPVSAPGLTSVGIIAFIYSWNEYMLASVFIRSDSVKTLSVGLSQFSQQFSVEWGAMMAAAALATIPAALFLVFAQKYIVQGLTAGAVKG
ncbi:MAG: carbohydrate ABC transporter permease [Eubacteriales bacterium]|nr:carbohydrate ABC transporter permease [Eubacteriales bacterium]